MRLRKKPWAKDELLSMEGIYIENPENFKGKWKNEIFENQNPIFLEIGTGRGKFLIQNAMENPDKNYVAFERADSVLIYCTREIKNKELKNIKVICDMAEKLEDFFEIEEVEKIFLNFSDPWPKKRYAKRRLTHKRQLQTYDKILKLGGLIEFKTDNKMLFEFSLEEIKEHGYDIQEEVWDLHNSNLNESTITTEYEDKFVGMGINICRLKAIRVK